MRLFLVKNLENLPPCGSKKLPPKSLKFCTRCFFTHVPFFITSHLQGMVWNGAEISIWNMEDARMEWNGRFQEWNGRHSSILPYQCHIRFCALYLQKNKCRCWVVINNFVTKVSNFNIYAYYLSKKLRYFGCVHCAHSVLIAAL